MNKIEPFPSPDEWRAYQSPCPPAVASALATQLMGFYPRGQAHDPDVYMAGVAATLAEYPEEVVRYVTDPRTGVARHVRFLPSIAEIAEYCDRAVLSVWAPLARAYRERHQQ